MNVTDNRHTDHAIDKCVGIPAGEIACTTKAINSNT